MRKVSSKILWSYSLDESKVSLECPPVSNFDFYLYFLLVDLVKFKIQNSNEPLTITIYIHSYTFVKFSQSFACANFGWQRQWELLCKDNGEKRKRWNFNIFEQLVLHLIKVEGVDFLE